MDIAKLSASLISSLDKSSKDVTKAFKTLASGKRINSASDDAAGLAIVSQLESDVKTTLQGARNGADGESLAAIADSALGSLSDITSRQQELAAQAANGTLSDQQRSTLNDEYQQLQDEKARTIATTQFNGVNVFNSNGITLQVGTGSGSDSQISIPAVDTSNLTTAQDISSASTALSALDNLGQQTQTVAQLRGQIGASVSRLQTAEENNKSSAVELESAASRIRDADVADETAKLTAASIRQQGTTALIAQTGKLNADTVKQLLQ